MSAYQEQKLRAALVEARVYVMGTYEESARLLRLDDSMAPTVRKAKEVLDMIDSALEMTAVPN